jgi:methyl-accepting chemotaxis protein
MAIDVAKLQQSFRKLTPKADLLAVHFYDTLFDRYPDTLTLFTNVRFPEQREKLIRALALVIRNLERPDFLAAYLQGLGAIHVAYGVKPEHYEGMGECLLHALARTAGRLWDVETERVWREAYQMIADTMLEGASRVAAPAS